MGRAAVTTFSDARAEKALRFIANLTQPKDKWAGQPFNPRPWQTDLIRELFGRMRADDLTRRAYRTCYIEIPRKNGKSTLAAALALYGLVGDGVRGAEVYLAANDREQASLVYDLMVQMVRNDPVLSARLKVLPSQKRIVDHKTGSVARAISAEAYSKHGFNASMVIYDELHAAISRELWDVLVTSMGARWEPLMVAITTAGWDRQSICWEQHQYAQRILDGTLTDPEFFPVIFAAPPDADWTDEQVWKAANPALEDFRDIVEMRGYVHKAKAIPAQQNTFRRLYLNQWTEQAERWIDLAAWQACAQPIDWSAYRGRKCYVGLDLSSTRDMTALVAVFPEGDGGFTVLPHFFVPKDTIRERTERDRVKYAEWEREQYLTGTPGRTVNYEAVRATLREWSALYDVRVISYDPWNATDLVSRLEQQDGFTCAALRQGFASLAAPTKELERAILARDLRHDGHPVLTWHVGNVAVESDASGNIKISKKASADKIDGVAALVCAIDPMTRDQEPASIYDTRGLLVL